jgi:hypothetical protein
MNKLIFASLVSVGAMLAAQVPATPAPAAGSKTTTSSTAKVKKGKKHHSKKTTAVNANAKPATK